MAHITGQSGTGDTPPACVVWQGYFTCESYGMAASYPREKIPDGLLVAVPTPLQSMHFEACVVEAKRLYDIICTVSIFLFLFCEYISVMHVASREFSFRISLYNVPLDIFHCTFGVVCLCVWTVRCCIHDAGSQQQTYFSYVAQRFQQLRGKTSLLKRVFVLVCDTGPGEEFLPPAPEPEDIVWGVLEINSG